MPTVRSLPADIHRILKVRITHHRRCTEIEIRSTLESALRPAGRVRIGTALAALSSAAGLTDTDVKALRRNTNQMSAMPMGFD
ncbi:FitA-like ribbon-helix-helix domain-containing protein [Stenotrophomonas tumulicola]|nr:plasmid stabilization protein [Stenotrophomonas tumulicola]